MTAAQPTILVPNKPSSRIALVRTTLVSCNQEEKQS
jgi:hypothetical protein